MRALAELKATGQDFEWYPTTDEIGEDVSEFFGTAYHLSNVDDVIRLLT